MGKARLKLLIIIAVSCFISSVVTALITVGLCNSKTASYQDDSAYLKIKIIDLKRAAFGKRDRMHCGNQQVLYNRQTSVRPLYKSLT